jgi:hypothetical protein
MPALRQQRPEIIPSCEPFRKTYKLCFDSANPLPRLQTSILEMLQTIVRSDSVNRPSEDTARTHGIVLGEFENKVHLEFLRNALVLARVATFLIGLVLIPLCRFLRVDLTRLSTRFFNSRDWLWHIAHPVPVADISDSLTHRTTLLWVQRGIYFTRPVAVTTSIPHLVIHYGFLLRRFRLCMWCAWQKIIKVCIEVRFPPGDADLSKGCTQILDVRRGSFEEINVTYESCTAT